MTRDGWQMIKLWNTASCKFTSVSVLLWICRIRTIISLRNSLCFRILQVHVVYPQTRVSSLMAKQMRLDYLVSVGERWRSAMTQGLLTSTFPMSAIPSHLWHQVQLPLWPNVGRSDSSMRMEASTPLRPTRAQPSFVPHNGVRRKHSTRK